MAEQGRRATSLEEFSKLAGALFAKDKVVPTLSVRLRPTDVVITPYGKSGTTWTQQIVHTLRTGGDMDFDDISRVVPWIETSGMLGIDLDAEQRANPRAFKSHLSADVIPAGARYINVVRNPADVLVSMFKFQEGWFFEPGSIDLDEFAQAQLKRPGGYFHHLVTWWARRNDPDVLFLAYERMLKESRVTISRIADFIGIDADAALLDLACERSSLDYMLAHKDRFDDALMRALSEEVCGLPPGSDSAKVRAGKAGSGATLSAETQAQIDEAWDTHVTAALGYKNYSDLMSALS